MFELNLPYSHDGPFTVQYLIKMTVFEAKLYLWCQTNRILPDKKLKISREKPEAVNRRKTDNLMTKRKIKRQSIVHEKLHRTLQCLSSYEV
jgi:hypothetical protein